MDDNLPVDGNLAATTIEMSCKDSNWMTTHPQESVLHVLGCAGLLTLCSVALNMFKHPAYEKSHELAGCGKIC